MPQAPVIGRKVQQRPRNWINPVQRERELRMGRLENAQGKDVKERLFTALRSRQNLTFRTYFSASEIAERLGVSKFLGVLSKKPGDLKVLEIGAGSGRFAKHLIMNYGFRPENYAIADLDYAEPGKGPLLVKECHEWVRKGRMKKLQIDVLKKPKAQIGKVDLILMPDVSGDPKVTRSLLKNYLQFLEPEGSIVLNRARVSKLAIRGELGRTEELYNYFSALRKQGMISIAKVPFISDDALIIRKLK